MAKEDVIHINSDNWKTEVLDSDLPVLVDFWAEWCGPCLAIAPVIEEVAGELVGKMKVAKVNVDENQQLSAEFGVRSIPTLLIFQDGSVQEQMVGSMSKSALMGKIEKLLA